MQPRERLFVYGLLLVLLGVNAAVLLGAGGGAGTAAFAQAPAASAPPVSSLTLAGDDGQELVLRNRGQRLAWGDEPHQRAHSVGYVYIGRILRQLMQSEAFGEERERLVNELNESDTDYRQRIEAIRAQLAPLEEGSAEWVQLMEQGKGLVDQFTQWQQQAIARRGQLDADHLERAYREMIDAVEVVADRKAIDTIYRFIPTEEPFEAQNPDQAMIAIRMRTALRSPGELDITDDVMEELSLDLDA